jgi:hypothetical protein
MHEQKFSLGITLWPRRRALAEQILCSWGEADPGALRAELEHIAEIGFSSVRLPLRWAEAMPGSKLLAPALRGLERALDRAGDSGLRATVALLGGELGGALHLPAWAAGYRLPGDTQRARRFGPPVLIVPDDQPELIAGDRYRAEPPRDLYGEPELLEAQRTLLREAVGNLAAHPAADAWELGAHLERVRRPGSARAAAEWWADLASRAAGHGASACAAVFTPLALRRADCLRPARVAELGGRVSVSAAPFPPLPLARPDDAQPIRFVHALTAALIKRELDRAVPVWVADLGVPTTAAGASGVVAGELVGRPMPVTLATHAQQATLLEDALAALHRDGAAGVWLAPFADLPEEQWRVPPADRSWWARTAGIVTAGGEEKLAAEAVRAFAARLRAGALPTPAGPPTLALDPERYWRDPARAFDLLRQE